MHRHTDTQRQTHTHTTPLKLMNTFSRNGKKPLLPSPFPHPLSGAYCCLQGGGEPATGYLGLASQPVGEPSSAFTTGRRETAFTGQRPNNHQLLSRKPLCQESLGTAPHPCLVPVFFWDGSGRWVRTGRMRRAEKEKNFDLFLSFWTLSSHQRNTLCGPHSGLQA